MTVEELEKGFQEVWLLFKETDKKIDRVNENLGKRIGRVNEALSKRIDHVDETLGNRIDQVSVRVDQLTIEVDRVSRNIDSLGGKWGRFVEGLVAPAIERLFQERGIPVDKVYQRVKTHKNGRRMEIDILVTNAEYAILVEAKSTLGIDDVNEHLQQLKDFKSLFPEFEAKTVFGAVAGIVIEEGVDRYAYKKGLFVLGQSGETVKILNDEKFQPATW